MSIRFSAEQLRRVARCFADCVVDEIVATASVPPAARKQKTKGKKSTARKRVRVK